jgi:hypothetical protein
MPVQDLQILMSEIADVLCHVENLNVLIHAGLCKAVYSVIYSPYENVEVLASLLVNIKIQPLGYVANISKT